MQAEFAVRLETARLRIGTSDQGQYSQARLALTNFRANLVAAESTVLDREATIRALLGLPPTSPDELVPVSAPVMTRYEFDWENLLELAERNRPDLVELKLVLEADYQQLLLSRNQALPQVDAVALYRWNGLEGELPSGAVLRSPPGAYTDWQFGVNFSVPLGLRAGRASVRQTELLIARDRVSLDQRMLEIVHEVASSLRQLDRQFSQYEALRETRLAAIENLKQQTAGFRSERIEFINVLQALTDWGNAVSAEAQSLSQYNAELARLEQRTGTILEAHGVRFYEERFQAIAPLGLLPYTTSYPRDLRPTENADRYPRSEQPADELFREDCAGRATAARTTLARPARIQSGAFTRTANSSGHPAPTINRPRPLTPARPTHSVGLRWDRADWPATPDKSQRRSPRPPRSRWRLIPPAARSRLASPSRWTRH